MDSPENQSPRKPWWQKFISIACLLFLGVLSVGTLATFFARFHWIAEIFCHLRIQLIVGLVACLVVTLLMKQKWRSLTATAFIVANAIWILPYFLPASTKRATEYASVVTNPSIKIMSANVLTSNRQYESFIDTVKQYDPDVLIVMEINQAWSDKISNGLDQKYPYKKGISKEHNFGIGILSKLPLTQVDSIIAEDTGLISLDAQVETPSGRPLRVIGTHPFPPLSQHCFESRSKQLVHIAGLLDPLEDNVIAGDFNLTPWSPIFSDVLAAGDLKDSRIGFGPACTWNAFPSFIGGIQIDHVLTSQSIKILDHQVTEDFGSDHRAVVVEIQQPQSTMTTKPNAPANQTSDASKKPKVSVVYSPEYLIDLGGMEKMHPFDIRKYEKIYEALAKDGLLDAENIKSPSEISAADLRLIHTEDYLERLTKRANVAAYLEADVLKLYPGSLDKAVLRPFRFASGGTLLAGREALKSGIGVNIGGGYHHAKPNIGEGFCVYADVPIAIRKLQQEGLIKKALVIDVDVHQGNGTAECLAGDDSTFTFSMHQGDIYPIPKATSDRDVEMKAGDGDREFLDTLEKHLDEIIAKADADICFIVGGCDPLDGDPLAELKMTPQGIADRDAMIVKRCVDNGLPVVLTLSGGYSKDAWRSQYLSIKGLIETWGSVSE